MDEFIRKMMRQLYLRDIGIYVEKNHTFFLPNNQ